MMSFLKDEKSGVCYANFLTALKVMMLSLTSRFGFNEPTAKRRQSPNENYDLIC